MSAASASQYATNHWWSRSKPSKHSKDNTSYTRSSPSLPHELEDKFDELQNKHSSKFHTLASVMRLKPKKHAIAIQDPPSDTHPLYSPVSHTSHASKAVSSITDDDGFEPKTPPDPRPRSVMTISDPDPFASNTTVHPHSEGQDPTRLSVISDISPSKHSVMSDSAPDYRQSYASTSSHGLYLVPEPLISDSSLNGPITSLPINATSGTMMIRTGSDGDEKIWSRQTTVVSPPPLSPTPTSTRSLANDGFAVAPSRPTDSVKSRGMIDVGPNVVPLVLVRQSSMSRLLVGPSSPPPSQALPPVPSMDPPMSQKSHPVNVSPASSSSSSISFASSVSDDDDKVKSRQQRQDHRREQLLTPPLRVLDSASDSPSSRVSKPANTTPLARTISPPNGVHGLLRKAASQRSIPRVGSSPIPTSSFDNTFGPPSEFSSLNGPKKQRSFGHTRTPLSTVRHVNSSTPSETSPSSPNVPRDKEKERQKEKEKRESNASSTRKRLFSPSTRRSSTQMHGSAMDDDAGSVLSVTVENDSPLDNSISFPESEPPVLPPANLEEPSTSPTESNKGSDSFSDYTALQIMSPADMLKVEADMNNWPDMKIAESFDKLGLTANAARLDTIGRARGSSFVQSAPSEPTDLSGIFSDRVETSAPISFFDLHTNYFRVDPTLAPLPSRPRSASTISYSASVSPSLRPSTSQGTFINTSTGDGEDLLSSLPPPPRRRPPVSRQQSEEISTNQSSTVSISPPPIRRNKSTIATPIVRSTTFTSSVEVKVPHSSLRNNVPRRSIMKKPSFLEIGDEIEADMGTRNNDYRRMRSSTSFVEDSFLDLGRGDSSFDTVRSVSSESQGS